MGRLIQRPFVPLGACLQTFDLNRYSVVKSKRRKNPCIKLNPDCSISVLVPWHYPSFLIKDFVKRATPWLIKKHQQFVSQGALYTPYTIESGRSFLFKGQLYSLKLGHMPKASILRRLPHLFIFNPIERPSQSAYKEQLKSWLSEQAHLYITPRVYRIAKYYNVAPNHIRFKALRSRWGSCSIKKNLNFNIYLMMAPPSVINYVIVHEVCHLKELNHSPKFWDLVTKTCPHYNREATWLKRYGPLLQLDHDYPKLLAHYTTPKKTLPVSL